MDITSIIYQLSLDESWLNDQFGDVESPFGWNGLIKGKRYIFTLNIDTQGFKYVSAYDRNEHDYIMHAWNLDKKEYCQWAMSD